MGKVAFYAQNRIRGAEIGELLKSRDRFSIKRADSKIICSRGDEDGYPGIGASKPCEI